MVRRDRECPFREELIAKESGVVDTQLRVPPRSLLFAGCAAAGREL